jgi:hypothetical protein
MNSGPRPQASGARGRVQASGARPQTSGPPVSRSSQRRSVKIARFSKVGPEGRLVILLSNSVGNVLTANEDFCAVRNWCQRPGHSHLTAERRIVRFEFDRLHDPLVGNQLEESSPNDIGMLRRLARRGVARLVVGQRHSIGPALAWIVRLDTAVHAPSVEATTRWCRDP